MTKIRRPIWVICGLLILYWVLPQSVVASEKTFTNSIGMEFVLIPAGTFLMDGGSQAL